MYVFFSFFFFQAEDGIRDHCVTGVQTCALPIWSQHASTTSSVRSPASARIVAGSCGDARSSSRPRHEPAQHQPPSGVRIMAQACARTLLTVPLEPSWDSLAWGGVLLG